MQINDLKLTAIENALDQPTPGNIAAAHKAVQETRSSTATDDQLAEARAIHANDDLEIDDDATVSEADNGYWVQAWVWVPQDDEDDSDVEAYDAPAE